MWVDTADLPTNAGHPFFERLNRVLEEAGFDAFVEELCAAFYAARMGRPSLRPGRYFRLLLIGYFEGLSSERGIAWRVADSLSLRSFLDLDVTEAAPDHSTLSRTRRLIDVETHVSVFTWVLERLVDAGLVRGKTVGIDATTLEANAAMRSIERRDTGESYEAFVRSLAEASGVETPTRADLARFDRSRKNKKTSNKEWKSPQDPDAKIAAKNSPSGSDCCRSILPSPVTRKSPPPRCSAFHRRWRQGPTASLPPSRARRSLAQQDDEVRLAHGLVGRVGCVDLSLGTAGQGVDEPEQRVGLVGVWVGHPARPLTTTVHPSGPGSSFGSRTGFGSPK